MPYIGNAVSKASQTRRFDVTGSTSATHTLSWVAPNEQSLIVTINGVKQHEDAYSVSGTTLTLTSALVAADKLEVVGIIDVGTTNTPAQDSVNTDQLATTGTASSSTFLRGDMAWTAVSDVSGLSSVQTFTSSGTWTKPSGIRLVMVEVQGAGGSGCAAPHPNDTSSTGGAGGGYAKKPINVSSISTATITVGTGGAAISAGGGTGNTGGNSIWADGTNTVTGNGGTGGHYSSYASVLGGTGVGGDVNIQGQRNLTFNYVGNTGGSSVLGFGGSGGYVGNALGAPSGYGGGGGGDYQGVSGAGTNGIVIVTEFK